jgi:hypothetical protein
MADWVKYEVLTVDGKTVHVESVEATPAGLAKNAKNTGALIAREIFSIPGREPQRNDIAIAYHAIILIRPKS